MLHKRVRVDDYTTEGRVLRITGRAGYETSTDLWIERTFGLKFGADREELEERGWFLAYDEFYSLDWDYNRPNLHGDVEIDLRKDGGLNDSMENLQFKPVGCDNHYNCYPKMQRKILPYLIPFDRWGNVEFMTKYDRTITMGVGNTDAGLPESLRWDPTHNGNFVVTFVDGADDRVDVLGFPSIDSLAAVGFCPRNFIQFGGMLNPNDANSFYAFDTDPALLPVYFDADDDELHWNTARGVVVRISADIFGSAYFGADDHIFQINRPNAANTYDFDSWTAKFDQDGVAGRNLETGFDWLPIPPDPGGAGQAQADYQLLLAAYQARLTQFRNAFHADVYGLKNAAGNNIHYVATLDQYEEFLPLLLWRQNFTDRVAPSSGAIPGVWGYEAGDPFSGTPVNANSSLVLWLRVPRFSKGQPRNWSMHPGLARFTEWFDKEVDGDLNNNPDVVYQGSLEELVSFQHVPFPTPWHQFAYTDPEYITSTKVGTWDIQWVGTNPVNILNIPHYSRREPISFTIDLPGADTLWNYLLGLPADEVITFKLVGGVQIIGPFPTSAQQLAGIQAAVDPTENREVYLRFQRRHALFTALNGSHQLFFSWHHLVGVDANGTFPNGEFPNGKPFTCGTADLYPRGMGVVGWIDYPAAGRSLIMHNNQTNFVNLNQFYMGNVTEGIGTWNLGSKPLFATHANIAEQYQAHDKEHPADLDAFDDSDLFMKLNAMFSGDVFIESPKLDDYRTVKAGQNKAELTLREPLFGLESGMSTYGVNRIFNNNPWYSLLLQDIDLFIQPTDTRQKIFASGNTYLSIEHNGIERGLPGVTMKIVDESSQKTTVTVRTRDGRDQRTKMLLESSNPYPFIRQYKGVTPAGLTVHDTPTVTISIYSERGIPDWFFIFAEREFPVHTDYIPDGNPIVVGVDFFARTNKSRSLCNYMLSKHELWQTTRRNSHPEADMKILLEEVGGILIGKADLGTLEFDELSRKDCFDYDMVITLENELDTDGNVHARVHLPITVTIAAIYENGVVLKGGGTRLSFVEIKETNY